MGLLKKATNQTCYLKAGVLGFAGSGKTYTATDLAIGLCKYTKKTNAAFFDTETGSDFMIPKFKEHGIELFVHKGRAFVDLLTIIKESEREDIGVLIIDSISHVWRELTDSYTKRLRRKNGLYFQDWANLKGEWQQFSDLYVNSKLHIIMCGRAGFEYDMKENEETGKMELLKTGTKMKVESEMGFEPSLLIEMERIKNQNKKGWINQATILKDRTDKLNGAVIQFPKFENFMPVINFLNIGGEHVGVDVNRNSEDIFEHPDRSYAELKKQRAIALEQLQDLLVELDYSGTSKDAQKKRITLLKEVFGCSTKTEIENLNPSTIFNGIAKIKVKFYNER